ncbi:MAG: hypothetical protein SRB2_00353 [Desulfobacteraceae bacterium Eth-SRB2]|nr:MAG: hypothetical protein SRB2_00353 [Desulfobacteraceae bacterium Eth-SRB2]
MKAKDRHKQQPLEYLGNPENKFCTRYDMGTKVLGFKDNSTLYRHFTPNELSEIEVESLEIRRKKYSPEIAKVDLALLKKAQEGDVRAAKLCYERFEGWSEKMRNEITGDKVEAVEIRLVKFADEFSDQKREVTPAIEDKALAIEDSN